MLDLSIIIPVYNTPVQALERCFNSVVTLHDIRYEVLLIDDGSQESTGSFCRDYAAQHPGFLYFYQENAGASAARNTGMGHAQGRYIAFLDADDTLMGEAISPEILTSSHRLIIYDLLLQEGDKQTLWSALPLSPGVAEQELLLKQLILSKSLNSPCGKLFDLSVIRQNNLQFDTEFVTGEDWNFICDYVLLIAEAFYCGKAAYCYDRSGTTSLSRVKRFPDRMLDNALQMFRRKQILRPDLSGQAAAIYLEELFNTAADLLLLKAMTRQRKAFIRENAGIAAALLPAQASKKAKLKAFVLRRFWSLLWPLAFLRKLYLKQKH